jgi:Sec-independent protein translocase protein TatA
MFTGKFDSLEQQKAFEKWAFGQTPVAYNDLIRLSWNSHHGDLYFCDDSEVFGKSMGKMLLLFKVYMQGYRAAEQAEQKDNDKLEDEEQDDGVDQIKTPEEAMKRVHTILKDILTEQQK